MRRAHILQHVPFEGLGSIAPWLKRNGYTTTWSRLYNAEPLPPIQELDLLIILGGPMSVNDEDTYPGLADEKEFIYNAIQANIAILGICLGAQLIAASQGARVYPNTEKEIGWFPVTITTEGNGLAPFPPETLAFHWHGETFDLPSHATLLASSAACKHQAFQIGRKVIGLQFHLETTPESANAIVTHCADELVEGRYIQPAETMLGAPDTYYDAINAVMTRLLDYLHASPS